MKVLHILNTNKFSGAENVVCQIISMFSPDKDVEMVYCSPDGEIKKTLCEKGISFAQISKMNVKEIKRVIGSEKPDIIHAHDMRASYVASLACGKLPLVSHIHNNASDSQRFSPKSVAYISAAKKAKHIFWVSKSAFDGYVYHDLFKKKSSVLYNVMSIDGIYEKAALDKKEYDYDIVFVGRLSKVKDPERLLNVCSIVKEKKSDVKMAIIGDGELAPMLERRAVDMGLTENIFFLGFLQNPLKVVKDSRVMIMTSINEGTPMCVLESQALGIPLVSTPVDGLLDVIEEDVNGYLRKSDEEIAEKVLDILNDGALFSRLSSSTLEKARKWNDLENCRQKLITVYNECLRRK